jgi:hypothetical protein
MRTDRGGRRTSDLDGPGGPPPPTFPSEPHVTVHGFVFESRGHVWDSRHMANVPRYVCAEVHGELTNHGPHWSCSLCQAGGTGETAEQAMSAAFRALDAKQERLVVVLNAVFERTPTIV